MSDEQFRAVLDWWMCSDPFPEGANKTLVDEWLAGECKNRGYGSISQAYFDHMRGASNG